MERGGAAAPSDTPPPERSGANNREGAIQSPRAASGASEGGAGAQSATGGTGEKAYARGGTHNDGGGNAMQTPRQSANFRGRTGREDSMDERPAPASGGERGDPKRAATTRKPPLCCAWSGREETRSDRIASARASRAERAIPAAGWPRSGRGAAQPPEERDVASDESGQAEHVRGNDSQARSEAERAAGWTA